MIKMDYFLSFLIMLSYFCTKEFHHKTDLKRNRNDVDHVLF